MDSQLCQALLQYSYDNIDSIIGIMLQNVVVFLPPDQASSLITLQESDVWTQYVACF